MQIRVRYAETDKMGVVYHGNYFTWYEVGRIALLDAVGYPYKNLEQEGYYLPVLEAHSEFLQPAFFDDELTLSIFLLTKPGVRFKMGYEIHRGDALINKGETSHAFIDSKHRPVKPPRKFLELLSESISVSSE